MRLCDNPVLIDQGKKSFSLDKWSGKKCYMLSARDLMIVWGDTPEYWRWTSEPSSRFAEAAELLGVCWLEISGKINTCMLSPETLYMTTAEFYGFEFPAEVGVGLVGSESCKRSVYLDAEFVPIENDSQCPKQRRDGWLEIELGEFFNRGKEDESFWGEGWPCYPRNRDQGKGG